MILNLKVQLLVIIKNVGKDVKDFGFIEMGM